MSADRGERLRLILALEIDRITRDLRERLDFLVQVWSRYRRRDVFLDTIFSRWRTVTAGDLTGLDERALLAIEAYHAELDRIRLYLTLTEDMPNTLRDHLTARLERLERAARPALDALGGAPERLRPDDLPMLPLDEGPSAP
jgi:hypothetical protein